MNEMTNENVIGVSDSNTSYPATYSSGNATFTEPIKITHYGYVFEPAEGASTVRYRGEFEGTFVGNFDGNHTGVSTGTFIGDAWLNKESNISEPLYNDTFIQALMKDYFYNHFIEWVNL